MTKSRSAVAEIARLVPKSERSLPWWDRVEPTVAAALPGVLRAWHDGKFGPHRRPAAKAIAAWLRKNGVEIREQGVEMWLRRNAR